MTTATHPPNTATVPPATCYRKGEAGLHAGPPASQTLRVPFRLPGLNDIIGEMSGHLTMRGRRVYRYTQTKKRMTHALVALIHAQGLQPVTGPVWVACEWTEAGKRRDPDNIAAGGMKLILDALKAAGIIANDGWRHITGFEHRFGLGKPGVTVRLFDAKALFAQRDADDMRRQARDAEAALMAENTPRMGDGVTPGTYRPTDGVNHVNRG